MFIHQYKSFNNIIYLFSISIRARPPKNLSVLPEDLKLDYGENLK